MDYLGRAKASAGEVRAQLYVALDVGYLEQDEFAELYDLADKNSRQLARFIAYLQARPSSRSIREDSVQYDVPTF